LLILKQGDSPIVNAKSGKDSEVFIFTKENREKLPEVFLANGSGPLETQIDTVSLR